MKSKSILFASLLLACLSCNKEDQVKVSQESYPIPGNDFFPEGIAYNAKTGIFYTGSTRTGDIVQVHVQTGATTLFASGAKQGRTFCTGMKLDGKGRLWVCGGSTGIIQVLNSYGELIRSWDTKALFNSGFINDCIMDDKYIYFTDSQVRKIYRTGITSAQPGDLEEWLTFTDQQIPYSTGTNANGIEITKDNRYLIVVVSNSGRLFRVNISNKSINEILLNTTVQSGDGIWLEGKTLYVSRNATGMIFPVELNSDYTQGIVGTGFGGNITTNTTLAKAGKYFLVVEAQFSRGANPVLPFRVVRVGIP